MDVHVCKYIIVNLWTIFLISWPFMLVGFNYITSYVHMYCFPPDFWYFLNASLCSYREEHAYITPEWGVSVDRAESPSCLCTGKYCNLTHLRIYITYVITNLFISILLLLKWYFINENPWLFFCYMDTFK